MNSSWTRSRPRSLAWGIGAASVAEIELLNVRNATHLAMRRALRRLPPYDHVLVDGQKIDGMEQHIGPYTPIVKGDASSYAIACASVVAKVTRDRLLTHLASRYPGYGWEHNAGYATRDHVAGLLRLGISPHHRRTYRRIRAILEGDQLAFDLEVDDALEDGALVDDDESTAEGGRCVPRPCHAASASQPGSAGQRDISGGHGPAARLGA